MNRLELPPTVIYFYSLKVDEICEAFAYMDDRLTPKENRFSRYLLKQIEEICKEHYDEATSQMGSFSDESLDEIFEELNSLVGIHSVKDKVMEIANFARLQQKRIDQGMEPIPTSYHAVYTGESWHGKNHCCPADGARF